MQQIHPLKHTQLEKKKKINEKQHHWQQKPSAVIHKKGKKMQTIHSFTKIETPSDKIPNKTLIKSQRELILNSILGFTLQKRQIEGKNNNIGVFFFFLHGHY